MENLHVRSRLAERPGSGFVVTWNTFATVGVPYSWHFRGRFLDENLQPTAPSFLAGSGLTGYGYHQTLDSRSDGSFVLSWHGVESSFPSLSDLPAQRFGSDGAPVGNYLQINSSTGGVNEFPDLTFVQDSNLVVTFKHRNLFEDRETIEARLFRPDGTPLNPDFQVSAFTTGKPTYPKIAANDQGDFIVVWTSEASPGSDDSRTSIQARLFSSELFPFFENGFETGDLSGWSESEGFTPTP